MSRYSGRRGEPERAKKAAHYMACGYTIRRSLRLAGYSSGVANRGRAAIRHSQLLQRAMLVGLAEDLGAGEGLDSLQESVTGALLTSIAAGRDNPALLNLLSPFPSLDFSNIRTEYYGRQRRVIFICG